MFQVRTCMLSAALTLLASRPLVSQKWFEQGPAPTVAGQVEGIPDRPVAGSINAMSFDPTDSNIVYIGTTNGGIWKTTNATADSPVWIPLTDQALPALSINSVAVSPVDPRVVFGGTGETSSFGDGSPGFGVVRSTNGGKTWTVLAGATFAGRRINSIVPTTLSGGAVVMAATLFDRGGVWRSIDGGESFTRISGAAGSNLPDGGVSNLMADPADPNRFYAAVPSRGLNSGSPGVYKSTDGGLTWTAVNTGLTGLTPTFRILLSVHNSPGNNAVYAAVIGTNGKLSGVFRTPSQGSSWTAMGVPAPEITPGSQGIVHGSIVAHGTNPNVVFVAGDRQNSPFPNANGCRNFSANVFRGDATLPPASPWQNIVCNGAHGTSPHADSRAMVFDANGNVVQANDGGIYRLVDPDNSAGNRRWVSMIGLSTGSVRPTEMHSAVYDPVGRVVIGGTQDTGTVMQTDRGSSTWFDFLQGDGAVVAVDGDQTAHPGASIRYTSFQFLGSFNRSTWDAANNFLGFTLLGLNITSGPGTGLKLRNFDPNVQFYNPYVLNAVNPSRMLIGTANIYESLNRGDSLANLGFTGQFITALAYGGRLNGQPKPDVFYVGTTSRVLKRINVGDSISTLTTYPGSGVRDLVMDPRNYKKLYLLDNQSRVWASLDEGVTWLNLTANLPSLSTDLRTIEIIGIDPIGIDTVLLAGGLGGVFQINISAARTGGPWVARGAGLPNGLVLDLRYEPVNDVLVAGILGRGAWTLAVQGGPASINVAPKGQPPVVFSPPPGPPSGQLEPGQPEQQPQPPDQP